MNAQAPLALAVSLLCAASGRARADWWVEGQGARDAPLGTFGSALVFDRDGQWAAGFGVGFDDERPDRVALIARAGLLRVGRLRLQAAVTASVGTREREIRWQRGPEYEPERLRWRWSPGYRADAGLAAEWQQSWWKVRLEAGVGLLGRARCVYVRTFEPRFDSDCDDPQLPADVRLEGQRIAPYISLGAGVSTAAAIEGAAPVRVEETHVDRAYAAPTALTLPAGTVSATAYPFLIDVQVGVTDELQLGAVAAISPDNAQLAGATLRFRAVDFGLLHLSAIGAATAVFASREYRSTVLAAGLAGTVCLGTTCHSYLSTAAGAFSFHQRNVDSHRWKRKARAMLSPSAVIALAAKFKLVGELHFTTGPESRIRERVISFIGARVASGRLAVGFGVVLASVSLDDGDKIFTLPTGNLGWRW